MTKKTRKASGDSAGTFKGPERRRWPRLVKRLPVKVLEARPPGLAEESGFSIDPVWTRDLGGAGLGLNAPVPCPIGSVLELSFKVPGRDDPVKATVSVVYSKQETDVANLYRVGVCYKDIDEEQRQAIIYYVNDHIP